MWKYISVLSVAFLLPTIALADISISTDTATSSVNITIVSNSGGDGYLFAYPDKLVANFYLVGSCATSGSYQCNQTRAYANGSSITRAFATADTNTSLQLTDGSYTIFSRSSNSECYTSGKQRSECVAVSTGAEYANFTICSDGSCLPGAGGSSSTSSLIMSTTTDMLVGRSALIFQYFIELVVFLLIGYLIFRFIKNSQ